MKFFMPALIAALVALTPLTGNAQAYPAKPVKMIVPYPAGGGTPADGYTLLFTDSSTFLITPHLYSKLP